MLKKKAIRKIIITTFSILTIFILCIIPSNLSFNSNSINPKIETTYVNNIGIEQIYLLGTNNYLVRTNVILNSNNLTNKIEKIIEYLTIDGSNQIPDGLRAIIPKNAKLNNLDIIDKTVILNFNDKLFNIDKSLEERLIESIVYSLTDIDGIENVEIKINNIKVNKLPISQKLLPPILNKNYGINKVFELDNLHNINKVTIYYIDSIENKNYFVPVTKYLNDDREKIKIIIENLASNYIYEPTLYSLLSPNIELINYDIADNIMNLNFNQEIFNNDKILEEVIYSISESVFASYDVDEILFNANGEFIKSVDK